MAGLLVAEDIKRHYPVRLRGRVGAKRATLKAVDGVSFMLHAGRTLGIVGESGCGKTTTANLAIGLTAPTSGRVLFKGVPISSDADAAWREQRRQMQMVFQDPLAALDRRVTIGQQIVEPLLIHRIGDKASRPERARDLLRAVGLSADHFDRYPHELSGGQRQRAVLARALVLDPEVLVCDEPVSALDVSIQAQVVNLLQDMQAKLNLAYLFISHDLRVVRQVSDEVAVMYLGRIVEQGPSDRLFRQPEHPYTRALFAAIPSIDQHGVRGPRPLLSGEPPNPLDAPSGCPFRTRCPLATSYCAQAIPALEPLADGHLVACHATHGRLAQKVA